MKDWYKLASNLLKAEIKKQGLTYEALQKNLDTINVHETVNAIRNKINRGTFSFAFFLQCMQAMEKKNIQLD